MGIILKNKNREKLFYKTRSLNYVIGIFCLINIFKPLYCSNIFIGICLFLSSFIYFYIVDKLMHIFILSFCITMFLLFINIYVGYLFLFLYLIFMLTNGRRLSVTNHLKSGWTFAEPEKPEVQEFIKKWKLQKYVK